MKPQLIFGSDGYPNTGLTGNLIPNTIFINNFFYHVARVIIDSNSMRCKLLSDPIVIVTKVITLARRICGPEIIAAKTTSISA